MAVSDWSTTASENDAAPPNGAPEGMAPSAVNDIIRQMMADLRSFYDNAARLDATNTLTGTNNFTGALQYGSNEVGYRDLIPRAISASDSVAAADNGRAIIYSGTGGHTLTIDSDFNEGSIVTVFNAGSGNLTIAESLAGSLTWFNGSGTTGSGSRTLAVAGACTVWMASDNTPYIWGSGLS